MKIALEIVMFHFTTQSEGSEKSKLGETKGVAILNAHVEL